MMSRKQEYCLFGLLVLCSIVMTITANNSSKVLQSCYTYMIGVNILLIAVFIALYFKKYLFLKIMTSKYGISLYSANVMYNFIQDITYECKCDSKDVSIIKSDVLSDNLMSVVFTVKGVKYIKNVKCKTARLMKDADTMSDD